MPKFEWTAVSVEGHTLKSFADMLATQLNDLEISGFTVDEFYKPPTKDGLVIIAKKPFRDE